MNAAVTALRASLHALVPTLPPAGPAWPTGIPSLDAALSGGIPRGRLTELVGPRAAGRTTLARRIVSQVLSAGRWVAIVDATRTLAAQSWAGLGDRLVVIRPHDPTRATWCADRLLRSGVFGLVVLDGAPIVPRPITFRLSQLARDRDVALLVVGMGDTATSGGGGGLRLRVRLQMRPARHHTPPTAVRGRLGGGRITERAARRATQHAPTRAASATPCTVAIDKGAAPAEVAVPRLVAITVRLPALPGGADRRGAATNSRRPWGGQPAPAHSDA